MLVVLQIQCLNLLSILLIKEATKPLQEQKPQPQPQPQPIIHHFWNFATLPSVTIMLSPLHWKISPLRVYHGETLAIMGDIGSGKSTITNLIPRLFAIESGDILFKGKSIYEWNVDDLRAHIGYVPQKAYLFTGTIDMNVRYGAASGQVLSVEDVENACHLAKADEFINRLEGGYQYMVSQGGTNLSGGQRQRLAMARALVRKPDLFIFDDSFSALDGTTERAVRTALQEELQKDNRPALISVEQKVSAAKKADHILIINRGQVAGYGTHNELATTSTVYQQILASQEVTA